VLSPDLKTDRESLIRTVCGSEFQTDGAENGKERLEKSVLVNGWTSSYYCLQYSHATRRTNRRECWRH